MDKKPVVAGKFYPGTPGQLEKVCEAFVGGKSTSKYLEKPAGLILPHAGYVYSGKTAGLGIREIANIGKPQDIVIIGPNHTGYGKSISVFASGSWSTPLGKIEINEYIARELVDNEIIFDDELAHMHEHSIEVQLPLLQYAFSEFRIVPICMMDQSIMASLEVSMMLRKILEKYPSTLIVASSDFNHYDPHDVTLKKDELAISKILEGDIKGLYENIKKYNITMCGPGPISVVRSLFKDIRLIYHTTSAEFSQEYSYTVGYASFILSNFKP